MIRILPLLLLACAALADPVPVRFNADAAAPQTFQAAAYRGETLDIEARLTLRGAPLAVADGASATMHWQTNGMGAAWWTAPASVTTSGLVRARWTPAMDCGAEAYRVFLGVADGGSNLSYRANMLLRMVGSPGETPNALPLPTPFIDFAKVAWTNAPWGEGGGTLTEETDPVFGEWARTNALPTRAEIESGYSAWSCSPQSFNAFGTVFDFSIEATEPIQGPAWHLLAKPRTLTDVYLNPVGIPDREREMTNWVAYAQFVNPSSVSTTALGAVTYATISTFVTATRRRITPTKSSHLENDSDYATRSWILASYGGTNTWISIDGDLLGIYTCTNAATGTNTLWESSAAMGGQLSDVALRATNNTTRITALEARPDLTSWGDYAPDGTPNPDAEAMVYLNKALTLMGSGFSWATSGAYACLCQSGAVAFQVENAGEIRIGTDVATNYFGLVQGGSVTVGCRTDGIRVADGVAYLSYAYAGGAFPVVWFCGDLVEGVWQETTPVWTDNGDGTATAAVPATGSRGFFRATSTRETGAYFRSNVPAHFPAGVYGALAAEPVKYDSVITVQSGGHTYRIPAELVQ